MMNKKIKTIGGIFFVLLTLLIFLSQTIFTYNMPVITAVSPTSGKLKKLESATGLTNFVNIEELYSDLGGKVNELLVEEGDHVTKGQPLIHLGFDREATEAKLKELALNQSTLSLEIENIHMKIDKNKNSLMLLEKETYKKEAVSAYDMEQVAGKIEKAKDEYKKSKTLYDIGALTKSELDKAAFEIENLEAEYEDLKRKKIENDEKADDSLEEKEKAKQKQLKDYQYELATLEQDLKTKSLQLKNLDLQKETNSKALSKYQENAVIHATADGTILSIPIKKGQYINANALMASLGVGYDFKIECDVSLKNNFIAIGDECGLKNSSHSLKGVVSKITPSENSKKITVKVQGEDVTAGETFDVKFAKESADSETLIPTGAVNKDSNGHYLYLIKKRKGILGDEFYVEKIKITIGDSDNENTVVEKGISFFEPIVLLSDKTFSENQTVKLKNEGDFFVQ